MNHQVIAVVGAAGNIGYATSLKLREAGVPVRAILRDAKKERQLTELGCDVALADLQDSTRLRRAIANVDAVQVILPPASQAEDAASEMRRSTESLAEALEETHPNRVLAISDYGAHIREDTGMPGMFRIFEERLRQLEMPKVFLRSAEHMENWGRVIPAAVATGVLPSLHHPVESSFATVCARDIGVLAADLLLQPVAAAREQIVHAEGPRRYSANDVAAALSNLLGRTVTAQALPRSQWQKNLERTMSASAARLLINFFDAANQGGIVDVDPYNGEVRSGTTELMEALRPLAPS